MISTWTSVIVLLVASVNGERNEDDTEPCAKVQVSSKVVRLGSPVAAACIIKEGCHVLVGQAAGIEWHLDDRLIPSSPGVNGSSRVSRAVVSSFNHTRAVLTCGIQDTRQVVAGVTIWAGYPPEAAQNLSCQTNLTNPNTMTCRWDPGLQETHLVTTYTLHTEIWDSNRNYTYELPEGVHRYTIPRPQFALYSEMKIYVKGKNDLGEATSTPIVLEPLGAAKFDPPEIVKIHEPEKAGCLSLSWNLSPHQDWLTSTRLNLEVRLKTADSSEWTEEPILKSRVKSSRPVERCHLLHGTQYLVQIRVRYEQSPWSKWSSSQSGVTLDTAPTGRLDSWLKVSRDPMHKQLNIELFWKPSKQFRANSQNVSYIISFRKQSGGMNQQCSTNENYCTFQLPGRVKRMYLRAVNKVGSSYPTEIRIYRPKDQTPIQSVTAVPCDHDRSLLVQWTSVETSGLMGYVVEWRPLLKTNLSYIRFDTVDKNYSTLVISGSIEPYKPYGISVYPRFKDGIGLPQTIKAYLRQKAPSMVPKLQTKKMWKSHIELTWDEIPLDQRNGIIQSYTVFYRDEKGPFDVVSTSQEERKVILKIHNTESCCEAFMMVSTFGGSLNGSTIHFNIEDYDPITVVVIIIPSGVGLSLLIIFIVLTCFYKHKRLKGHLWPLVPDPANSSIKRWTSESTQYTLSSWDNDEPNPIYLSHLSFLDLATKLSKEDDDLWLKSTEETSDLGESICGSPFIPGYPGSNINSVPYASVIFPGPCNSPTPTDPHVYLRSESTQPLLETETESFSPECYQNMVVDGMPREQCFFGSCHECLPEEGEDSVIVWDEFPFLRALAMNDTIND
ncbi:granulocyte colony-stimulating factor receptor [Cololabis saira]|uniref:granulocyte colony-stimulating factor receptor n=1 Tax=Cololabis saira TaxID=129043 RepID=UPI002AD208E2|nr:granulocyte colony-stimulating factor receptor [Cololabis saira]XP_061574459.1 granulocyte colony-stimulating factor receptor [Cololabis saira]